MSVTDIERMSGWQALRSGGPMNITASAISLNVPDVTASARFVTEHFGFTEEMAADGFASLTRPDAGFNLVFLRTGLETFKPPALAGHTADGLLVVFVVDEIDAEYERLQGEGVEITTPLETEPWGERYFQVTDPNGVVVQLVQWVTPPDGQ
jgi:catechol 2,3-dioxygenase-like lactoylglutathione lyase family enzyme